MLHKTYWKIRKVVLIVIFFFKKNFYKASMYIGLEKTAFHAKKNVLIEVPKKIALNLLLLHRLTRAHSPLPCAMDK